MSQKKYDCILIPGGGLRADGSLPDWTLARLERALEIEGQAEWILTLSGGTVHKPPPLDPAGFPYFESRQAAAYLVEAGVDPGRILSETCSYDTIGNAYFSRVLFADPLGLARCQVITSEFHLARAEVAFRWVYALQPVQAGTELSFEGVEDRGLPAGALAARRERERESLGKLRGKTRAITTLEAFQRWLYREHAAYAIQGESDILSSEELSSY